MASVRELTEAAIISVIFAVYGREAVSIISMPRNDHGLRQGS
jgi:hypothetical protein